VQVDRLFEWNCQDNSGIQDSLDGQPPHVAAEFEKNLQRATLNLNEQGLNVALYWKNPDPRKYVNIVPTSAITGEGIPDMLQLVVQLTQVHILMDAVTSHRLDKGTAWR
jgi:translation initiation factor 5B